MNAVKKIFKLIRLGVFCKWFWNVKERPARFRILLFSDYTWCEFISSSFIWCCTNEMHDFWQKISRK